MQWPKEEGQTIQWPKEEGQTIQCWVHTYVTFSLKYNDSKNIYNIIKLSKQLHLLVLNRRFYRKT